MMTRSEENYLKTIFHLSKNERDAVSTNAIADVLDTKASSVTDMLKKLAEKDLVDYKKYQGVKLTPNGKRTAAVIVRKHRLWEVFLVDKLNFSWDEVHEVAEQLEHIRSEKLVEELEVFLDFPKVDPHGDPIPDKNGNIKALEKVLLSACKKGEKGICIGVNSTSTEFLQYLDKLEIALGDTLEVIEKEPFDSSFLIRFKGKQLNVSAQTANNIYIKKA